VKKGPKDKVVMRELCGIKSKGTRTYNHIDVFAGQAAFADESPTTAVDGVFSDVSIGRKSSPDAYSAFSAGGGNFLYTLRELSAISPSQHTKEYSTETSEPVSPAKIAGHSADGVTLVADEHHGIVQIGVTVTDCSTGEIRIAEFLDDRHRSRLRTLMARYPPAEFVYPRSNDTQGLSAFTRRIMRYDASSAAHMVLSPGEEFWDAERTARELELVPYLDAPLIRAHDASEKPAATETDIKFRRYDYFNVDIEAGEEGTPAAKQTAAAVNGQSAEVVPMIGKDGGIRLLPAIVYEMLQNSAALHHKLRMFDVPSNSNAAQDLSPGPVALSAFGGLIWYLRRCLIDYAMFSLRRIFHYQHADSTASATGNMGKSAAATVTNGALLLLNGATLHPLNGKHNFSYACRWARSATFDFGWYHFVEFRNPREQLRWRAPWHLVGNPG
jgi:hypothetical protein